MMNNLMVENTFLFVLEKYFENEPQKQMSIYRFKI